jgi:3-hydroxyisobutyrate dehydrogenase-like beta-hydroxyacid dehydrogenase
VKSVEHIGNISCLAIATEVGISPASVYHILTNSLGKGKVYTKWIPHMLDNEQRATRVVHTTSHLKCWRHEGNEFLDCILAVEKSHMHSFEPQLK